MILLAVWAAFAAPRVDPAVEPEGVEAAWRSYAADRPEAARELVCRRFAERTRLCFTRAEGKGRRYYTRADGQAIEALEPAARGGAADAVGRLEPVTVEGFATPYWMSAAGDGRDHAALLHPDALRARLGGEPVVAIPARGVLVAWVPGDVVFDKIVAVGILRMYDTLPSPVSPLLYRWNGEAWITWGEAREVPGAPAPTPVDVPAESPRARTAPLAPER
ncbi:MAG: hypothetical protein Q8P41_10375 [Pseudomonadota bacterium]|nr:hypothetical protein [Pseudomonadota bacterium]